MVTNQRMSVSVEEYLALPDVKPYLEYYAGEVVQKVSPQTETLDQNCADFGIVAPPPRTTH